MNETPPRCTAIPEFSGQVVEEELPIRMMPVGLCEMNRKISSTILAGESHHMRTQCPTLPELP
jgi:hypothetical protein